MRMREIMAIVEARATAAERFVARMEQDTPRGVSAAFHVEEPYDVSLQRLSVDPAYRGEGLATTVIMTAAKLADRMGVTLHLEAHPDEDEEGMDRDRLIAFYRRFGFQGGDGVEAMMFRSPKK